MDQYIWKTLFGTTIPYRPTYVPDTKLAKWVLRDFFWTTILKADLLLNVVHLRSLLLFQTKVKIRSSQRKTTNPFICAPGKPHLANVYGASSLQVQNTETKQFLSLITLLASPMVPLHGPGRASPFLHDILRTRTKGHSRRCWPLRSSSINAFSEMEVKASRQQIAGESGLRSGMASGMRCTTRQSTNQALRWLCDQNHWNVTGSSETAQNQG